VASEFSLLINKGATFSPQLRVVCKVFNNVKMVAISHLQRLNLDSGRLQLIGKTATLAYEFVCLLASPCDQRFWKLGKVEVDWAVAFRRRDMSNC
jgi:hypothetical protein